MTTRRKTLLGLGVAATGTVGSIALGSSTASATVSGDFSIPDGKQVLADSTLQDVRLITDASWEYSANAPMHGIELELHVGATESTVDLIARQTKTGLGEESLTGEATLNGSLMSASDFDIDDFRPSNGELRRTVIADLRFYALRYEEVVAEAAQVATFEVIVSNEELQVDITLGGTGEIQFTTDSG